METFRGVNKNRAVIFVYSSTKGNSLVPAEICKD